MHPLHPLHPLQGRGNPLAISRNLVSKWSHSLQVKAFNGWAQWMQARATCRNTAPSNVHGGYMSVTRRLHCGYTAVTALTGGVASAEAR